MEVVDLAVDHGATVAANVTKTVRLVIATNGSTDPRIERAHASGVQVLGLDEAQKLITTEIEAASSKHGLFGSQDGELLAAELAEEKSGRRGRPEWHSHWRTDQLSSAQYRRLFVEPYDHRFT